MWLAFDTETTGLPPRKTAAPDNYFEWSTCRLVQLAWEIRGDGCGGGGGGGGHGEGEGEGEGGDGRSIAKACYIIRPDGFTIPEDVVRIHGISTERALAEGVPLLEVLAEFADDMSRYGVDTAVAHNMAFDDSVLLAELYRAAASAASAASASASETCDVTIKDLIDVWTTRKKRCTMRMGARLDGANGKWPKLHVLYEQLCGPLPDDTRLHNADTDARLCADIYEKLLV